MMTPTIAPEAADGIYALIALIADPKGARRRLQELQDAGQFAADEKRVAAIKRAEAEAAKAEMDRTRDEIAAQNRETLAAAKNEAREAQHAWAKAKEAEQAAAAMLEMAQARDNAFIATSEQTRKDLETAATGVTEREARVAEREKNLAEAEMKANDLVREYQEKLAKLQSLIA